MPEITSSLRSTRQWGLIPGPGRYEQDTSEVLTTKRIHAITTRTLETTEVWYGVTRKCFLMIAGIKQENVA